MSESTYVSGKKASEILGVHQRTLYQWDLKNKIDVIRAPGGKRMYNIKKYLEQQYIDKLEKGEILNEIDIEKLEKKD